MEVDVIKFELKPGKYRVAKVVVGYYELQIDMDLVIYHPQKKLWLRMPEVWKDDFKKRYCFWNCREVSDRFQESVLDLLQKDYGITFESMCEVYSNRKCKGMIKKNPVHQTEK